MMPSTRQEQVVSLPAEAIRKCNGFSLDFGGSVLKLAYCTEEDKEEAAGNASPEHMAPVRLVSFSREELDEAIEFIKEHVYISRTPGQDTVIYTTGVGGYQYKEKIEQTLDIKCINAMEMDCFIRSVNYLVKTVPRRDMTTPFDLSATAVPIAEFKQTAVPFIEAVKKGTMKVKLPGKIVDEISIDELLEAMMAGMQATGDPDKQMTETEKDFYPIGLVFCGSAFGLMQVLEDGTYLPGDMSNKGGRAFLGMGHVFLGCKDYNELLSWAKVGDSANVDWCARDIATEMTKKSGTQPAPTDSDAEKDDFYGIIRDAQETNQLIFSFGKCVAAKREDFKKEDMAAALLKFYCMELAMVVDCAQRGCGLRHLFLVGSFVADEYVRGIVTSELTRRCLQRSLFGGESLKPFCFHFMPHGAHLGALGGLINCPSGADGE